MPIPSADIFSVDTVQVRPAQEAFRSGTLVMPTGPDAAVAAGQLAWGDSITNSILICVTAIAAILTLAQLVELLPFLVGGLFRPKPIASLEDSVRHARDRNILALVSLPAFVLIVSRFGLYAPQWMAPFPPGGQTLLILAVSVGYALLRGILVALLRAPGAGYGLAARSFYNFFIVATLTLVLSVGILTLLRTNPLVIKRICWIEIGLTYPVFLVRRTQILGNSCNQFTAFLYLCALELLPTGLLVASALVF